MHDPFFPPYRPLQEFVTPFAAKLNLHTLPLHIHAVLIAFVAYHLVFLGSPIFSTLLFPRHYPSLKPRTRINWDVHVVSFVQSTFISALGLYVIFKDKERADKEHRVFGYTGIGGATQAFALGYFLWDLMMSALYFDVFGIGFLFHALSAVVVYSLGFRPFVNFYAPVFILFELSSPMLNIHWFLDKLNLTGSKYQLYNGLLLIATFFCCRVIWGPIQAFAVFRDIYTAWKNPSLPSTTQEGILLHATTVPVWLGLAYLGSNTILNFLNFYWFGKMIEAVTKRFTPAKGSGSVKAQAKGNDNDVDVLVVEGTEIKVKDVDLSRATGEAKKEL